MVYPFNGKEWDQNLDFLILGGVVSPLSHIPIGSSSPPRKLLQADSVDLWAGQEGLMMTKTGIQT